MNPDKLTNIDYSALNLPANQLHPASDVKWRKIAAASGGIFLTFGTMLYQSYSGDWLKILIGLVGLTLLFAIIAGIVWAVQRLFPMLVSKKRMNQARLKLFCTANGFELLSDTALPQSGMQFRDSGITECGFRTKTMEIGNFSFYVSREGTHRFGYIRLRLPREVSQIVFDAKANNKFGWTNLNEVFDETSRVPIDLDFDTLYTVYAPKGYEEAARSLARQFREVLIKDGAAVFDMECVAYDVYLYRSEPFEFTEPTVRSLLQMAEKSEVIGDGVSIAGNEKVTKASTPTWFFMLMGFFVVFTGVSYMASSWQDSSMGRVAGILLISGLIIAFLVWAIREIHKSKK